MKLAVVSLLSSHCFVLLATSVLEVDSQGLLGHIRDREKKWETYKATYGKRYGTQTERIRRKRWDESHRKIEEHNKKFAEGKVTYNLDFTRFADYTPNELEQLRGLNLPSPAEMQRLEKEATHFEASPKQSFPASLDLRRSPCMPEVKNQGSCGSCWAFAAITPIEYQRCMATGSLEPHSEQHLIDCTYDTVYKNKGCSGGWYMWGWNYLKTNGLLPSSIYPYTATDHNECHYDPAQALTGVQNYTIIAKDEGVNGAMQQAIATFGPISLAICADCTSFYLYSGGIYNDPACSGTCQVDHAVVAVGYGTIGGVPVWVVRNSWGTNWGVKGYVFIRRGTGQNKVNFMPAVPIIEMKSWK